MNFKENYGFNTLFQLWIMTKIKWTWMIVDNFKQGKHGYFQLVLLGTISRDSSNEICTLDSRKGLSFSFLFFFSFRCCYDPCSTSTYSLSFSLKQAFPGIDACLRKPAKENWNGCWQILEIIILIFKAWIWAPTLCLLG